MTSTRRAGMLFVSLALIAGAASPLSASAGYEVLEPSDGLSSALVDTTWKNTTTGTLNTWQQPAIKFRIHLIDPGEECWHFSVSTSQYEIRDPDGRFPSRNIWRGGTFSPEAGPVAGYCVWNPATFDSRSWVPGTYYWYVYSYIVGVITPPHSSYSTSSFTLTPKVVPPAAPVAPVAPAAPAALSFRVRPKVSGTYRRGKMLVCSGATFNGAASADQVTYGWLRNGKKIAFGTNYRLRLTDVAKYVGCFVTHRNSVSSATGTSDTKKVRR